MLCKKKTTTKKSCKTATSKFNDKKYEREMKALKKDCAAFSKANKTKKEWKLNTKAFK